MMNKIFMNIHIEVCLQAYVFIFFEDPTEGLWVVKMLVIRQGLINKYFTTDSLLSAFHLRYPISSSHQLCEAGTKPHVEMTNSLPHS